MQPTLSILIPTIEERENVFNELCVSIANQIVKHNLQGKIEIVAIKDKRGENPIGKKRNDALQKCIGLYEMFVDDDDTLAEDALPLIIVKLEAEQPDCIAMEGIITENGQNPKTFIHSLKYNDWFEKDGVYYRPPNHLNPIKSSIAKQFAFPEISHGEDREWSMAICKAGVLKTEATIGKSWYNYKYISNK